MLNLDKLARVIFQKRPKLVLSNFELFKISKGQDDQNSSIFSYGLNQLIVKSYSITLKNSSIDLRKFKK
jgi:hypothetical protein